ncbi:AGE family epimerase/isomerase [Paenibacillus sp. DMB20]|uniref:AGE family epimerase/isomerase n=1 Tax=Paenibacillus sp. DMB20 TaxID=1642570 RepID=UPI0006276623|nr:AGE family epimerase/isomerase [Paenibacillus sp. DMB20]KKO54100.1 N-acylglucosamine 2-epimerase [Paenibacillus sp. DMB20]
MMKKSSLDFYRNHVNQVLLPFWERALDERNGGVYTCFNNAGTERISTDKYTWSQGRFVWIWSRLARLRMDGLMQGEAEPLLAQAGKTARFLRERAFLENGHAAFLLTEDGKPKESFPGAGYDSSFYADCFVVLGFTEYARAAGDREMLGQALAVYDSILSRLDRGDVRSEPYPAPEGLCLHAYSMIMLNVSQELAEVLRAFRHGRAEEVERRAVGYMDKILDRFVMADGTLLEMVDEHGVRGRKEKLLCRYVNPGHAIECMWFVMKTAEFNGRADALDQACAVVRRAFELGWDPVYGGLLRFVDYGGGEPEGDLIGDGNEDLILGSWDTKLWWPHSEALYSAVLAYDFSGDDRILDWYERVFEYAFSVFPNPDAKVGEWIQIRDRQGRPLEKVVALPVKDPYHVLRNMLLIIERLSERDCKIKLETKGVR